MEKKSLRRKSPQRAERLTRGKDAPSQGGADPLSSLQSPKIDSPPPDGQGFVRIRSTYRLKGAKPLVPEDAANAFTTNLRRISVIRVERVQSGAQKVSSKRLLQHQDSRYEGASQPKNPSSFLIIELEILRILGIEETQLEAIRKLPMKRARETCERLLAEHPQEVEKLKKAIEPAWEEAWREAKKALDASARKPQTTEEILTWTEYEQRYQRNKEEVVEALPEGDLDALFYYLPF
ncbi:MAG TPA: hypothetical protein VKK81_09425, partial [Candidatus Binatia bacterium]|nr:hypothetical protein [Candidatus Binatia bacterium]